MKIVNCLLAALLLSSCIILPFDHDRGWGHGRDRWGGWHGERR